ncbi:unnamed protein product, partial [Discosporangium mesarthrocarpum]
MGLGGVTLAGFALLPPVPASDAALPFLGGDDSVAQEKVLAVAQYQKPVNKLEEDLRSGILKGGTDDSAVVRRYLDSVLKPLQETMVEAAPLLKLQSKSQERMKILPLLMKGHLLELEMACNGGDAKEQLKEVDEVGATLEEFLTLA